MSGKDRETDASRVYIPESPGIPEPDTRITDLENQIVRAAMANDLALKDLKLEDKPEKVLHKNDWHTDLPHRPGFGTTGEQIKLWTNYFHINITDNIFYRYAIKVKEVSTEKDAATATAGSQPSATARVRGSTQRSSQTTSSSDKAGKNHEPSGKHLSCIVELLLAHSDFAGFKKHIVSDFSATLLSMKKLPRNPMVTTLEGESHVSNQVKIYNVTLEETGSLDLSNLNNYLESLSTDGAFENRKWFVQALSILLRHHARSSRNITTLGRKVFPTNGGEDELDFLHCLSALRGFDSSVRLATSRILVKVNINHSTFYKAGPHAWRLTYFMSTFEEQITKRDETGKALETAKNSNCSLKTLENFLHGLRVRVCFQTEDIPKGVIKVRRISGLANVDDGRHSQHLLKYPPMVPYFGAVSKHVGIYDSPDVMNRTLAEIEEAGPKSGDRGKKSNPWSDIKKNRAPTNDYISVEKYAHDKYNVEQDLRYPVVNVGDEHRPVYLNPYFCWVIEGQVYSPKLSPKMMEQMLKFAVRKPGDNANSIKKKGYSLVGLSSRTNPSLKSVGVKAEKELLLVKGRILVHPKVKYGPGQADAKIKSAEWTIQGRKFYNRKPLSKWACLCITMGDDKYIDVGSFHETLDAFVTELRNCGIDFIEQRKIDHVFIRDERDKLLGHKILEHSIDSNILFVLLPKEHTLLYDQIKIFGDVRYGIHTVCVARSNTKFSKGDPNCWANIAHKVNLKLGGINHAIGKAQLGIISEGKTMVVGYSITHPTPASNEQAPSIAAMVASIDKELGQWPADMHTNKAGQVMIDALGLMFKSRLALWKQINDSLPENILIYRAGVAESQYKTVVELEINKQIRPVCQKFYNSHLRQQGFPHITFIVVGKRHHTRLYPTTTADTSNHLKQIDPRTSNPAAGTVIDRGITEAHTWDFFLQSHTPTQGTARPAHYTVLLDEIFKHRPLPEGTGFESRADVLENLTHNMCYLFGRATKAVSICPPVYYADLACKRARRYLHRFYDGSEDQASGRADDDGALAEVQESEIQVDKRIRNSMFYI